MLITILLASFEKSEAEIVRLTVDCRPVPTIGVDNPSPEFAWTLKTDGYFDVKQVKYSVSVASSTSLLDANAPDYWRSGEVVSEQCFGVKYAGKPLASSQRFFCQVTVVWRGRTIDGTESEIVEQTRGEFVTGIMAPNDWRAKWITAERADSDPLPLLYRVFTLDQEKSNIVDAFLHVCGLGQQIVSVDSSRVGNRSSIDPGWTNYKKTCLYVTYDVKQELVSSDSHSISVLLGNGMYNVPGGRYVKFTGSFGLPQLIAQLVVRYKDGSIQTICSDESWRFLPSPVVFSCVYGGDDLDFSLGVVSENRVLARGVPEPAKVTDGPGGVLRAQIQQPVVSWETLKPNSVRVMDDGKIEADFGFNFAGRPVFRCVPAEGSKVEISLAEMRDSPWNGHSDSYLFGPSTASERGEGIFSLETARVPFELSDSFDRSSWPHSVFPDEKLSSVFGYWGFQYAYFDGAEYEPDLEKAIKKQSPKTQIIDIEAERVGADLERFGSFESDGKYLDEIELMVDRSARSNIVSLFTDCPHREKLGWLEETHLMGPSILYRYNIQTLYRKICRDMTEAQLENGMIPDIAPEYTRFVEGFFWSAEWSSACVQVPWVLYRWYGDEEIIGAQYETMDKYVRFMASTRDERGLVKAGLGDWYDWSPERRHAGYSQHTPGELTATAFLCDNARIMEFFAEKLGKSDDALFYRNLNREAVSDFQRNYFNPETKVVATGSQASYAFALSFDLVPEEYCGDVFQHLLKDIEKWDYRPSCGEVAWPFLIRALSKYGRADVLWKMLQREDAPGYVHMLTKWGMKTLSETWDGPGSSMNHFMFGAILEWFSSDVAGIRQADDSVAFGKSALCPHPMPGKINRARGDYLTPYGKIVSDWSLDETSGAFTWKASVPPGTTSRLEIPVANETSPFTVERALDSGDRTERIIDIESVYQESEGENPGRRIVTVGSGDYIATSKITN